MLMQGKRSTRMLVFIALEGNDIMFDSLVR